MYLIEVSQDISKMHNTSDPDEERSFTDVDVEKVLYEDDEDLSEVSCWPLVCASAKKPSHKGLNIDKLTSKPVIRNTEKKKESVGWLSWIFGIDLSFLTAEVPEDDEEETASSDDNDSEEEEIEDINEIDLGDIDFEDIGPIEQLSDEELAWYSVDLVDGEDWFSVDLLGAGYPSADGRDWWEVELLAGAAPSSWLGLNMFGGEAGSRYWYEVNLLGEDRSHDTKFVCADIDHDSRAWYDVAWTGFCDDGVKHWYEVDLFGDPTVDQGFVNDEEDDDRDEATEEVDYSVFGVDWLGDYRQSLDSRSWYEVDLYRDPVVPDIEEEEYIEVSSFKPAEGNYDESGYVEKEIEKIVETVEKKDLEPPKKKVKEVQSKQEKVVKEPGKKSPSVDKPKQTSKQDDVKIEEPAPGKKVKEVKKEKSKIKEQPPQQEKPVVKSTEAPKASKEKAVKSETKVSSEKQTEKGQKRERPIKSKKDKAEDEAKMAEIPIPSAKKDKDPASEENASSSKPSSEAGKLIKENNNVVAFICE